MADTNAFKNALMGMERVDPGTVLGSPLDDVLDGQFASGNGVLKLWRDMPADLLESGVRLALQRSTGQSFRVEHATDVEAKQILADLGRT